MAGRKPPVEKESGERWLVTYADLMNLLLILFILLYSMSVMDAKKFSQLSSSLSSALGTSSSSSFIDGQGTNNSLMDLDTSAPASVIPSKAEDQQMNAVMQKLEGVIAQGNLKGKVDVTMEDRGVVISINEQVLFKSGSAEMEPGSKTTIEDLGSVLLSIPGNQIRVEGYTDNDPIQTSQFPSNWELSAVRATNVLRVLVDKVGVDPSIISAVGYGEYRPKVPNTTEESKATNRRVNIVIVKNMYDTAEAGMPQTTDNSQSTVGSGNSGQNATQNQDQNGNSTTKKSN